MVRMITDRTGRFVERPHYSNAELDRECEDIVNAFLTDRYGRVAFPIATDDLDVLIENTGASIDTHADLSRYGDDVEGVAEFFVDKPPLVSIAAKLAANPRRENRRRTTLAHEFGHVHFHGPLFREALQAGKLLLQGEAATKAICRRVDSFDAPATDWLEWQAGYVSGAILMPASPVRALVADYCGPRNLHVAPHTRSDHGLSLTSQVMEAFAVSADAARVRLLKLGLLTENRDQFTLFG